MRRRIVFANQSVGKVVKLGGESVRQKIPVLPNRLDKINIVGKLIARLIIFVVEEIIFPIVAAEVRINFDNGNFAVNVNQIALGISLRPTKILAAAVNTTQREVEVQIKIFRVIRNCQPCRNFFRREKFQKFALNRQNRRQIFFADGIHAVNFR